MDQNPFFQKINKIHKTLATVTRKIKRQFTNIRIARRY